MTFSIVGQCAHSGMLGIAITTSSICVGSRCSWARAGVGAVATQNFTDPRLGVRGLGLLAEGLKATEVMARLIEESEFPEYRQLAVIDRHGQTSYHSGNKALGIHDAASGDHCIAAGNLLSSKEVPRAMVSAFMALSPAEHLAERLLRALEGGLAAGGEIYPLRSAGLLVVDTQPWPLVDLRVDWHESPVSALGELWRRYEPEMKTFLLWALDPDQAPSFPLPGNDKRNER